MRAFKHVGKLLQILFAALLFAVIFSNRLLADDKDSTNPPAKSAPAKSDTSKIESPAPLTERERWMLDRMEQLEKRIAELEAKSSSAGGNSAAAKETVSAQPTSASLAKAVPPVPDVLSPEAAVTKMKTQEKAGKPEK